MESLKKYLRDNTTLKDRTILNYVRTIDRFLDKYPEPTIENINKFMSFAAHIGAVHRQHAPFRHWYLLGLGVDPAFQGKGFGGLLLKTMFAKIARQNLACYLETQNKKNVPFYQHYGFNVVEESTVPGTAITNWAMVREKTGDERYI